MDPIKEAFSKAKQDISDLKVIIEQINEEIKEIKRTLNQQTDRHINETNRQINPTLQQTHSNNSALYSLKSPNNISSNGNEGVPTDRQTNQQTNQHTENKQIKLVEAVESVEFIRSTLKSTFLNLTKQEKEVFLAIYEFEEQGFTVDYALLAQKLKLTESSIRDYVLKIIKKGIPLKKTKENNKKIILSVAAELKKVASRESIESFYKFNADNRFTE